MKSMLAVAAILLISLHSARAGNAVERGVNYDPVHSFEFARAAGLDDRQGMIDAINADLDKLIALHDQGFDRIRHLKTFFTTYSSLGARPGKRIDINIADVVADWNRKHPEHALRLAPGVYEFRRNVSGCPDDATCAAWTQAQLDAAVAAANRHPELIDRIVVGNEDIDESPAGLAMEARIAADIRNIRSRLQNKAILVGTAQVTDTVSKMLHLNRFQRLRQAADFVGVNVYPYWGGVAYGDPPYQRSPAKDSFQTFWNDVNNVRNHFPVIETEEGWPSDGHAVGQAQPSADRAHDYFQYWYHRDGATAPVSYYFALFDKSPGQGTESHWGIFSADRNASLLGAPGNPNDRSKPLANGHALVEFDNRMPRNNVAVNACAGDWDPARKMQQDCYPIDGYAHTGDIAAKTTRRFMIDATGASYASLNVVYYAPKNQALRLCYIDKASLLQMRGKSRVNLIWRNDAGDLPCDVH